MIYGNINVTVWCSYCSQYSLILKMDRSMYVFREKLINILGYTITDYIKTIRCRMITMSLILTDSKWCSVTEELFEYLLLQEMNSKLLRANSCVSLCEIFSSQMSKELNHFITTKLSLNMKMNLFIPEQKRTKLFSDSKGRNENVQL